MTERFVGRRELIDGIGDRFVDRTGRVDGSDDRIVGGSGRVDGSDERIVGGPERVLLTRRRLLAGVAVGGALSLAGCLGGDDDVPDPISLEDGQYCDQCNMDIAMHPGPTAQAYYPAAEIDELVGEERNGPAWFCSGYCLYDFVFDHETAGYEPAVSYATDYSTVEYALEDDGGATVISANLAADGFATVTELTFVVDSDVQGAMGGSLIGFSSADDADAFSDEHGGDRYGHEDLSPEVIASL